MSRSNTRERKRFVKSSSQRKCTDDGGDDNDVCGDIASAEVVCV